MSLTFHFHPLSSFCQKALIALYENDTPFERHVVDLGNEASRAAFLALWPVGKMPVLRDEARDRTVAESTIIIEYLAQHYPGKTEFIPRDAELARETRMRDRFFDLYVHMPMQKVVTDKLRPAGKNDTYGVQQAKAQITTAYGMIEEEMRSKKWAMGEAFTLADCAAGPALFFANIVLPLGPAHRSVSAYLNRLVERPSFARSIKEAEPFFALMPKT